MYYNDEGIFVSKLEDAIEYSPIATCKCVQKKYKVILADYERMCGLRHYKSLLKKYAEMSNVTVEENAYGDLILKTKLETWIVSVLSITEKENIAEICLYHKNNIDFIHSKTKCGTSLYPDYHVQYQKKQSIGDLVLYIVNHEEYRWRVPNSLSEALKKLLKTL